MLLRLLKALPKSRILLLSLLLISLLFTRFYNLDSSATFFWDQTEFLVKNHQYFVERTITLVGAISEDGSVVWSSLTNYMLMPFTVLGDFDPLSITIGASFWGFLTALLLLLMTKILNKKMIFWIAILVIIWFPLVETSRWAWNVNLIPFWIALGIIFYQNKRATSLFLSGLSFGLTIHHHYLAVFALGAFAFLTTFQAFKRRTFRTHIYFLLGLIVAILPFVIFDLRHPPGLFWTRFLYFNKAQMEPSLTAFLIRVFDNFRSVLVYYTHSVTLGILLGTSVILLLFYDLRKKSQGLIFALPWFSQIAAVAFLENSFLHYFLPGLVFLIAWLIYPREKLGEWISKLAISILILGSIFTIIPQIQTNPYVNKSWQPNTKTVREITNTMEEIIKKEDLKGVNVAVLGSQDINTYGLKYRNLLLIKGIRLLSRDEYFTSDHLFVVSQSSEDQLRKDPSPEMHKFREGQIRNQRTIDDSGWAVYLFDRAN